MITATSQSAGELFTFSTLVVVDGYAVGLAPLAPPDPPTKTSHYLASTEREFMPLGMDMERRFPLSSGKRIARDLGAVTDDEGSVLGFVNQHGMLFPADSLSNTYERFLSARDSVRAVLKKIDAAKRRADDSYERRESLRSLAPWFNREVGPHLRFGIRLPTAKTAARALRVEPASLYSAIGLLLALEISGDIDWKPCALCGKQFAVGAPGDRVRRRDAETCSQACTQLRLDERKATSKPARAPLAARACAHCGDTYTPKRASTMHCGKAACAMALSRLKSKGASK